jgi:hypothetical protein
MVTAAWRQRRPRKTRPALARLCLDVLEGRNLPSVSLGTSFAGLGYADTQGYEPPDTCGAAGPVNYVETVNQTLRISNKATGAAVATDNFNHFFYTTGGLPRTSAASSLSDPIVVWDEQVQRFIIGDQDVDVGAHLSRFQIAVSKSATPGSLGRADWYFVSDVTTEAGLDADYPGNFGYNHDAFVFTLNMFDSSGRIVHGEVNSLKISDLVNGTLTAFRNDTVGSNLRPTVMHDSVGGDPMWLVSEGNFWTIDVAKMDNVLSNSATFTYRSLTVSPYLEPVAAKQPDGTAITPPPGSDGATDGRIQKAAEFNNNIVACQAIERMFSQTEDDARWYRIDVSSGTPVLRDQGDVRAGDNTYIVYPSIDINANGDIGMTYIQSGTGSGQFMSMYVTGRTPAEPAGTMATPVLVQAGTANYHDAAGSARAGDLSGISLDADGSFWAANEYATNAPSNNWGTWITHFNVDLVSSIAVGRNADGRMELFGIDDVTHAVWHKWQWQPNDYFVGPGGPDNPGPWATDLGGSF